MTIDVHSVPDAEDGNDKPNEHQPIDNVPHSDLWVVNYQRQRSSVAPFLKDWMELRSNVLTNLATNDVNLGWESCRFRIDLLSADPLDISEHASIPSDQTEQSLLAIRKLRQQAANSSGTTDVCLYTRALLLNMVFRLLLSFEMEYEERKQQMQETAEIELNIQRCLVLGGILCQILAKDAKCSTECPI